MPAAQAKAPKIAALSPMPKEQASVGIERAPS
jgi:hypothetical protein